MNRIANVVRLHLNRRVQVLAMPYIVMAIIVVATLMIYAALVRLSPDSAAHMAEGVARSGGFAQGIFWFMFATGTMSTVTDYPVGRALGAGRRGYGLGTAVFFAVMAAYVTLAIYVGVLLDYLTQGWFVGLYVFRISLVTTVDPVTLGAFAFVGGFLALSLGALFGAVWLRFGTLGVWVVLGILVLALVLLLWLFAPSLPGFLASLTSRSVLVIVASVALASCLIMYALLQRVNVRTA